MNEFEHEPIRGLPARPPQGEQILWQGAPRWQSFARRAFRFRALSVYFGLLALWCAASLLREGASLGIVFASAISVVALAGLAAAIFLGLAWAIARSTVYTITSRRVVVRFGVALPMTINIPFKTIASANARIDADGGGDIVLSLMPGHRIGYLVLWPHVRPWRFKRPQPMLRCIAGAHQTATILGRALAREADAPMPVAPRPATPVSRPAGSSLEPEAA